jgi:transcriptional regulator with XRE-family HTH domain
MTHGVRVQHLLRERVAEEVRVLLARKMMTGADLAAAIGRSPMYVSRRIRGEVAFDIDDMQRLAEVFDVEVLDLLPKKAGTASDANER